MKKLLATGVMLLASCTTVVENDGKLRKPDPAAAARSRVAIAAEHLKSGENEKAQQQLRRALEADPKSPEAHNLMAVLLERDGDVKGADREYRKAIRLREGFSQAHNNYGSFLFRQQRYKDAIKQFALATATWAMPIVPRPSKAGDAAPTGSATGKRPPRRWRGRSGWTPTSPSPRC